MLCCGTSSFKLDIYMQAKHPKVCHGNGKNNSAYLSLLQREFFLFYWVLSMQYLWWGLMLKKVLRRKKFLRGRSLVPMFQLPITRCSAAYETRGKSFFSSNASLVRVMKLRKTFLNPQRWIFPVFFQPKYYFSSNNMTIHTRDSWRHIPL